MYAVEVTLLLVYAAFAAAVIYAVCAALAELFDGFRELLGRARRCSQYGVSNVFMVTSVFCVALAMLRWLNLMETPPLVPFFLLIALVYATGLVCAAHVTLGEAWHHCHLVRQHVALPQQMPNERLAPLSTAGVLSSEDSPPDEPDAAGVDGLPARSDVAAAITLVHEVAHWGPTVHRPLRFAPDGFTGSSGGFRLRRLMPFESECDDAPVDDAPDDNALDRDELADDALDDDALNAENVRNAQDEDLREETEPAPSADESQSDG